MVGWARLLELGGAPFGVWFFKGCGFWEMSGSPRKKRREFPVKATGTQRARPGRGNRDAEGAPHKARQSQRRPLKKAAATSAMRAAGRALRRVNQGAHGCMDGLLVRENTQRRPGRGVEKKEFYFFAPTQASRPGLTCDAPPALESGWRGELAATGDGERCIAQKARDGAAVFSAQADAFAPLEAFGVNRSGRGRKSRPAPFGMTGGGLALRRKRKAGPCLQQASHARQNAADSACGRRARDDKVGWRGVSSGALREPQFLGTGRTDRRIPGWPLRQCARVLLRRDQ
jgi:hypothetical protein